MRLDSQGPVAWYRLSLWCFEIAGSRFRAFGDMKYWSLDPGPQGPFGPLNLGAPTWGPQGPDPFSDSRKKSRDSKLEYIGRLSPNVYIWREIYRFEVKCIHLVKVYQYTVTLNYSFSVNFWDMNLIFDSGESWSSIVFENKSFSRMKIFKNQDIQNWALSIELSKRG